MATVMHIVEGWKENAPCSQLLSANPFQDGRGATLGTGRADSQSTTEQQSESASGCNHPDTLCSAAQGLCDPPPPKLHMPTASLPGVQKVLLHRRPQLSAPGF